MTAARFLRPLFNHEGRIHVLALKRKQRRNVVVLFTNETKTKVILAVKTIFMLSILKSVETYLVMGVPVNSSTTNSSSTVKVLL